MYPLSYNTFSTCSLICSRMSFIFTTMICISLWFDRRSAMQPRGPRRRTWHCMGTQLLRFLCTIQSARRETRLHRTKRVRPSKEIALISNHIAKATGLMLGVNSPSIFCLVQKVLFLAYVTFWVPKSGLSDYK